MNDIFENTETMQENEHPRFYTAESVMRGHPDKLCDLIADSVLDACLQHDPASRVACEVMATHGHIIVAGEITTKVKPDVFNIVRDTLRDVGYDPKDYQIDCYIHDQSPDIAGAVEPELAEGEDEDTLGAGDQGVMVGYACNETPEYLPMPVVAAQRLVTLLEIFRMTGIIPDIGPDGKVQVTMEYNGDTPVRITTVVVSVQHKEDSDMDKLADLLDEYVFPLAFDGMPEGISVPARKVTRPLWGRCTRITAERLPGIISARCSTSPRRAAGRYHRPLTTKWMNWSPRPSRAARCRSKSRTVCRTASKRSMFPRTARFMSATAWMQARRCALSFGSAHRQIFTRITPTTAKPTLRRVTVPPTWSRIGMGLTPPLSTLTEWLPCTAIWAKNSSGAFCRM